MKLTGIDIEECYRETGRAGLAATWNLDEQLADMVMFVKVVLERFYFFSNVLFFILLFFIFLKFHRRCL